MERVSSLYAENYFKDSYCDAKDSAKSAKSGYKRRICDEWVSPSDLLIGIVDLKPPFTSKITRGKTHEGILTIGDEVVEKEYQKFLKRLKSLIEDNEASWKYILKQEKDMIFTKVTDIYQNIFKEKSKIMMKEFIIFYENSLQELENTVRSEVQNVLISVHANLVSDLNKQIQQKMKKEREILENILKDRLKNEVKKLMVYYELLLVNEIKRNNTLINFTLAERNDALKSFYNQFQVENTTSTMYIMCMERKKCKIRNFLLQNYHNDDILDKVKKIKERQDLINKIKEREVPIVEINKKWQDKIEKILKIFLKFISFSLKLLPEQATFLLDLEKLVVLQLNEIQKMPKKAPSILIDDKDLENLFRFENSWTGDPFCEKEPFVVVGDTSTPPLPRYGSRETLPSDVDLPFLRLQRQFVYAECHKFEEIKKFLDSQKCTCHQWKHSEPVDLPKFYEAVDSSLSRSINKSESSNTTMIIDDIHRISDCPAKLCKIYANALSFPHVNNYIDFTEENFERVKTILGAPLMEEELLEKLDPRNIAYAEELFTETKEIYRHAATQYLSYEDISVPDIICDCSERFRDKSLQESTMSLTDILKEKKLIIGHLLHDNPQFQGFFTQECFDFQL